MIRTLGEKAERLFKQKGDLGLVAQELGRGKGNLTVREVHEKLMEITTASGKDSQSKKQQLIKELLARLDGLSARYVVRIILGTMRPGFSAMTLLDSLCWVLVGDKSLRPRIEAMYNVRADLGEITKSVRQHNRPAKIEPRLGTPILMARAERATSAAEIWERNGKCAVEYKLDGLRIQAHIQKSASRSQRLVKLFSRGLEDVTAMYPDVVEGLQRQIKQDCIVEGEMIAVGPDGKFLPFQETVQRKRKYDVAAMAGKIPLTTYLFDVLVVDGKGVMSQPNQERWEVLKQLVEEGRQVKLMPRQEARSEIEIEKFFTKAIADGTEGIIAKRLHGPYQAGSRDFNWIKFKKSYGESALADTIDAVVMGYDVGQGKRQQFGIGDFLIGVYQPKTDKYFTIAKVGTGLTDEEWQHMASNLKSQITSSKPESYDVKKEMSCDYWVRPKIVVEVMADEITKSPMHTTGLALRFPRLISWREKKPEDTTTIDEVRKMYETGKR